MRRSIQVRNLSGVLGKSLPPNQSIEVEADGYSNKTFARGDALTRHKERNLCIGGIAKPEEH